ncbi:MAG: 30S ribosomal protein S1 [Rudaea sp.]
MSRQDPLQYSPDEDVSAARESTGETQPRFDNGTADSQPPDSAAPASGASPASVEHPTAEPPAESFKPSPGWDRAAQSYEQGTPIDLKVIGYNRGGLLVDLGDVRGFVPASQLLNFPRRVGEEERMNELARYVGKPLHLKVIELDRVHNRLILSERVANLPVSRAEQVINSIQPGQTLKGTIRNVTDFGAFVDLGGVEGLIHVSEMSWQRVAHPRDVCTPSAEIEVYVIDVNREQRRVGLSLKRLRPDPWSLVAQRYHVGDIVEATITNVVSFGAFARLPEGVEGLIHTSELAEGSFLHPRDVVKEGQNVRVRIMNIEPQRQRIGLTLRLSDDSHDRASEAPPGGTAVPDAGYWDSLARES